MKIAIASDLHLEFGDIDLPNLHGADVLILGGDIMVAQDLRLNAVTQPDHEPTNARKSARKAQRYRDFLQRCSDQFEHVIYVAGNHEFYHGNFHSSLDYLREEIGRYPNVSFLENDFRIIDDVLSSTNGRNSQYGKVCKQVRHDDAPLVYSFGSLLRL